MTLLSVKNLSKIGREAPLFTDVTFGLNLGEKAALIGRNGTGKSTLLNCIAGTLAPDNGTAIFNKESGVSFLPQNPIYNPDDTINKHIFNETNFEGKISNTSPKLAIIKYYETLCEKLAENQDIDQNEAFHKEYEFINNLMNEKNLWNYEAEVKSILEILDWIFYACS